MLEMKSEILKIIENFAKANNVIIKQIEHKGARGHNFLSNVSKCNLIGIQKVGNKEKEYKLGIIIKEIPTDRKYVELYNCDIAFSNEEVAYNAVIPNLNKFCCRPLTIPQNIYVGNDLVLLKDLTDLGFQTISKLNGFTVDIVKLVLLEIANLHAASIIMQYKNNKLFNKFRSQLKEFLIQADANNELGIEQEKNIEMVTQLIQTKTETKNTKAAINILNEIKGNIYSKQMILLTDSCNKFPVFNHGDLWASNIMIKDWQIKLIDFQIMRCTSVAADLNYFFYVNLKPKFRVEHQDEFLKFYLNELNKNIRNSGLDLENELTMDWLKNEMRAYSIFGLLSALWILPVIFHDLQKLTIKSAEVFRKLSIEEKIQGLLPEHEQRILDLVYYFVENP